MEAVSVEEALSRDLRRLRRAAALFMVFLMLLPWFFRYVPLSYPNWRLPRMAPQELPEPRPVPNTYPLPVQWVPAPMEVFERWIKERYPGSLVGLEELAIVNEVARRWNINPGILVSIIGAEHSFLSPQKVGWDHALKYYQNPFSYGVYKGSRLPFAIGWEASASGAASIISRVIQTMPQGDWTPEMYTEFWRRLSGFYTHGDMGVVHPDWLRNVTTISRQLWAAVREHPQLWARTLLDAISVAELPGFVDDLLRAARSLAQNDTVKQSVIRGMEKFDQAMEALQVWLTEKAGEQVAEVVEPLVLTVAAVVLLGAIILGGSAVAVAAAPGSVPA
ncbi:MAG: hypothetical protein DIU76_12070 [Bacillota bacterium]|nr:MAG: hypothetical protein DIU76_12070 [Bacillota bacterium]